MTGPKSKYMIQLNEQQYKDLKHLSISYTKPWIEVRRARILLLAHARPDLGNNNIAAQTGCHADMVKKCRKRWQKNPSAESLPRPGSPRKFTALQRAQIVALACSKPGDHGKARKRWSGSKLAETAVEKKIADSVSARTVQRWLRHDKIKPWNYHSWQKPADPQFAEKAAPVLDLYEKARELDKNREIAICADEKTSVQARQLINETLPAKPDHPVPVCDRYNRKGALQLFCALIVATGETFAGCFDRKRFTDFQTFLPGLSAAVLHKSLKIIHLILDNGTTHAPKQLGKWIESLSLAVEVRICWLPKHARWLDQAEIIFSKVQRDVLTPCDFQDKRQLENDLMSYFQYLNQNPIPVNWTYTKEKMLTQFVKPEEQLKLAA